MLNPLNDTARGIATLGVALFALASPCTAFAENTERAIEGWSATGNEVFVHLVQRGERMVDGVSKDYYFEATEVYSARTGKFVQRYQRGEAVGDPPPAYTEAKPADVAARFRETVGLTPGTHTFADPGNTFRLVSYSRDEVREEDDRFRCFVRHRIGLLDQKTSRVWSVQDTEHSGETSRRRDEAQCPEVSVFPAWQSHGSRWAALIRVQDDWTLKSGDVTELEAFAYADFVRARPLVAELSETGPLREGWSALSRSHLDDAAAAFASVTTSEGALGVALVDAFRGDKKARKAADVAFKASDQTAWDLALRAATYLVLDDTRRATKWIDEAVKKSASFDELRRIASLFELVDVDVANQLAVHALSHPEAAETDTTSTWGLLARGLVEVGEFSKAAEVLAKVEKPDRDMLSTTARLALDKNDRFRADELTRALMFDSPGDCDALLLRGRLHALVGQNLHAQQLFESAAFCDPRLAEAVFYGADFARLSGDIAGAHAGFKQFLDVALPRRSDPIREARRAAADLWAQRLAHQGVVMSQASCQKAGGAYLCRGVVTNTTTEPITEVVVEVRQKKKTLSSQSLDAVAPGASKPFGLRIDVDSLDGATLRAGRTADEMSVNETPIR